MIKVIDDPAELLLQLDAIVDVADNYKDDLGFWPPTKFRDAIERRRLIAAVKVEGGSQTLIGLLVHSGVHPNSKIQAVAVHPDHVRCGVAQALLDAIISQLEAEHFICVCAKPAEDLEHAQAFYQKNGFEIVKTEAGGQARNRRIVVRERLLRAPSLFDTVEQQTETRAPMTTDEVRNRLWVIDINVLFDLLKTGRDRYPMAYTVIGAALAGRINVAVTSEFKVELKRNSEKFGDDPILALASALPKIVIGEKDALKEKSAEVHDLIFAHTQSKQAGTPQALSDSRHIAECALGNAAAFITSDGPLLKSRKIIRQKFGLEVAALDDFFETLSFYDIQHADVDVSAEGFRIKAGTHNEALNLLTKTRSQSYAFDGKVSQSTSPSHVLLAFNDHGVVIGYLNVRTPTKLGENHRMILIVDHQDGLAEQVGDALMGKGLEMLTKGGPHVVTLTDIPGQTSVRKVAQQLGFKQAEKAGELAKLVLGEPLTPDSIDGHLDKLRLSTGKEPTDSMLPTSLQFLDDLFRSNIEEFERLERSLSPGLLVSNHRQIIVQPIGERFASELLGTSDQMNFLEQFGGANRTEKVYVCSSNKRNFFRANQIILFYESKRTGGRGAVIAAANVTGVLLQDKAEVSEGQMKRTVLDSVDGFSSTEQVTLVTFNSLLRFPHPVNLNQLKRLGAHNGQNFVSATKIATTVGQQVMDEGWSDA